MEKRKILTIKTGLGMLITATTTTGRVVIYIFVMDIRYTYVTKLLETVLSTAVQQLELGKEVGSD